MALLTGALIGGALGGLGSVVSGWFGKKSSSKANKTNLQLAQQQNDANLQLQQNEFTHNQEQSELEYQRNLELWNLQNEYNSPQAQMARYQEAGLNPNLIYGTGTASAGNASAAPQYSAARYTAPKAERATVQPEVFNAGQAINIAQQLAMTRAQTDNIAAQTEFTRQETKNNAINNLLKAEELTGKRLSNRERDALFEPTIMGAHIRNRSDSNRADLLFTQNRSEQYKLENLYPQQKEKLFSEILNLRATANLKQFEYELNKIGINTRDPLWSRLGVRLLTAGDNDVSQFVRSLFNRK